MILFALVILSHCIEKSQSNWILSCSPTASGLCAYHFSVLYNLHWTHSTPYTIHAIMLDLRCYFLWVNMSHSLMWLTCFSARYYYYSNFLSVSFIITCQYKTNDLRQAKDMMHCCLHLTKWQLLTKNKWTKPFSW